MSNALKELAEVQSTMLITDINRPKIIRAMSEIKKLQAENAELTYKLGVCVNHLLLALNLDEIDDDEDKASIHAKANDFIIRCQSEIKKV